MRLDFYNVAEKMIGVRYVENRQNLLYKQYKLYLLCNTNTQLITNSSNQT